MMGGRSDGNAAIEDLGVASDVAVAPQSAKTKKGPSRRHLEQCGTPLRRRVPKGGAVCRCRSGLAINSIPSISRQGLFHAHIVQGGGGGGSGHLGRVSLEMQRDINLGTSSGLDLFFGTAGGLYVAKRNVRAFGGCAAAGSVVLPLAMVASRL